MRSKPMPVDLKSILVRLQSGQLADRSRYNSYFRYQSLEYIEAKSWRLESGDVAAD
jgi:hypothetical protein